MNGTHNVRVCLITQLEAKHATVIFFIGETNRVCSSRSHTLTYTRIHIYGHGFDRIGETIVWRYRLVNYTIRLYTRAIK